MFNAGDPGSSPRLVASSMWRFQFTAAARSIEDGRCSRLSKAHDLLCPVCLQGPFATGTDGPRPFVFFTPECPFAHVNVLGSAQCPFVPTVPATFTTKCPFVFHASVREGSLLARRNVKRDICWAPRPQTGPARLWTSVNVSQWQMGPCPFASATQMGTARVAHVVLQN